MRERDVPVLFLEGDPGTLVYPDASWRHDAVGLRDPAA